LKGNIYQNVSGFRAGGSQPSQKAAEAGDGQGNPRVRKREGAPFLAEHGPTKIPPLIQLPRLLSAADHVLTETDSDEDLRLLLAPGSSLGGARPKASVRDGDSHLAIAKFPNNGDEWNTVVWEVVALTLAQKAGIPVPAWRLETVADKPVLPLRRFDREQGARVPFVSPLSMLGARDNEARSYLEFVDILRQHGAAPKEDMHALWRRSRNVSETVSTSSAPDSQPVSAIHSRKACLSTPGVGWTRSPEPSFEGSLNSITPISP